MRPSSSKVVSRFTRELFFAASLEGFFSLAISYKSRNVFARATILFWARAFRSLSDIIFFMEALRSKDSFRNMTKGSGACSMA